jgi:hypothetical protein
MWRPVGQINIATVIPGRCAASTPESIGLHRAQRNGFRVRAFVTPGNDALKLQHLALTTGKTPETSVKKRRRKYSTLPNFGNGVCVAATRPKEEGRIAIVTNAGRAAVDAGDTGAKASQGGQP